MRVIEQPLLHVQQIQDHKALKGVHKTQRKVFKELQRIENKLDRQNQRLERADASSVYKRHIMKVDDLRANRADLRMDKAERRALKDTQHSERRMTKISDRGVRWQSSTYRSDTNNVGRSNLDELV